MTKIFQSLYPKINTSEIASNHSRLLQQAGYFKQLSSGFWAILPRGIIVLDRLEKLVDDVLINDVGAQKLELPALVRDTEWKKSGRLDIFGDELFKTTDRKYNSYVLSPTHEESICSLVSSNGPINPKEFPLGLYQMTNKYRDELRPRNGVVRAKEFLMKDLYSFHENEECCDVYYERVCKGYEKIFDKLGLSDSILKVSAEASSMKGSSSHEYSVQTVEGEDEIISCPKCHKISYISDISASLCDCSSTKNKYFGTEVGHCYKLGTSFSEPFNIKTLNNPNKPVPMGCFGLGLTRLIQVLHGDSIKYEKYKSNPYFDHTLFWPKSLVPHRILVLPQKIIDKEIEELEEICNSFNSTEIILDKRPKINGKRKIQEARLTGYRWLISVRKTNFVLEDLYSNEQKVTEFSQLKDALEEALKQEQD